jgi:putative transposase
MVTTQILVRRNWCAGYSAHPPGKIIHWLQERIKHWTKPATRVLIIGILSDITRNQVDLVLENVLLRQQLIVLNRQVKRLQLTNPERFRLVFLSHFTKFWKQALHIFQPDTHLRWHRELFRKYWRRKSKGKPKISLEKIALIVKMAEENHWWGADTISFHTLKSCPLDCSESPGSMRNICVVF